MLPFATQKNKPKKRQKIRETLNKAFATSAKKPKTLLSLSFCDLGLRNCAR
jgi:hypothetical protein